MFSSLDFGHAYLSGAHRRTHTLTHMCTCLVFPYVIFSFRSLLMSVARLERPTNDQPPQTCAKITSVCRMHRKHRKPRALSFSSAKCLNRTTGPLACWAAGPLGRCNPIYMFFSFLKVNG